MKRTFFLLSIIFFSQMLSAKEPVEVFITAFRGDRKAAISFTYDDGMLCHYTDVAPELEKRGFRGTFWIIGANMDKNEPDYPWMTWKQVGELAARGHEMSNHSWSHPSLPDLNNNELAYEIFRCDSALEVATGKRPITFCYPYNAMSEKVVRAASANRVGTRTFQDAQGQEVSKCTKESLSEWLQQTIERGAWSVTMTHGTTYGYDKWENPQLLWDLYDEVKSREDEVWVGTFAEVAAYREERENTSLRVRRFCRNIYIRPTLNLDERIFTEKLTLRVNGDFEGKHVTVRQGLHHLDVVNLGDHILVDFNPSGRLIKVKVK